jgi:class 3 adenylate cyclase
MCDTGLFCVMVQEIEDHGGDVIKFAGDCLICLWRRAPNTASGALAATDASCSMRRALAATRDTDLDIHCGIARGMVKLIHVGSGDYFEFLAIGPGVEMAGTALDLSKLGEVVVCPQVYNI